VTIPTYGELHCKTKMLIQSEDALLVQASGVNFTCLGQDGECSYQTSDAMPIVASVALSEDSYSLVFTGTGFTFDSSFTA
jgi:hypothetical protein